MNDKEMSIFLKEADILKEAIKDMGTLGYVGEKENKILGYLITISRKLDEPLSGIAVSSSGAGKSKLVDTLQALTPPEEVVFASRLTPQALYYMTKDFLKNKLLIIEERAGSEMADYAIRTLQSKGKLALAAPVKNQTVFFEVEGPVSVLETTTSYRLNRENITRCFILHLDESREQTERIHRYQRLLKTHKGIKNGKERSKIISFHHSIQRLLKKEQVIIPYAEKLSFPVNAPSLRRDNQKLLTLIEAVTLLYQYQRKRITKHGRPFIESTLYDYEIAYDIFKKAYRDTIFMTHPKAGALLSNIQYMKKDVFTRRDIANTTGWADYAVRDNIRYLEDAGLIGVIEKPRGKEALYRLNGSIKLTEPKELKVKRSSTG